MKLFLIAINDVVNQIDPDVQILLYADDICLFFKSQSIENCNLNLQSTLDKINAWMRVHGFKISPDKSAVMHFCRKYKSHPDPQLLIDNSLIPITPHQKFLGITFDTKLTWHQHINNIRKAAMLNTNILKMLSGTKWGAHRNTLIMLCHAFVLSRLNYGAPVFATAAKTALRKLDPVLNLAIRLSTGAFRTSPVKSILVEAGMLPLSKIREKQSLTYFFKILGNDDHPLHPIAKNIESYIHSDFGRNSFFHYIKDLLIEYELTDIIPKPINTNHPPWLIITTNDTSDDLTEFIVIKGKINTIAYEKWQAEWDECNEKLKEVKRSVKKWGQSSKLSRRESIALVRLRIGHTRYTHSYIFNREQENNLCETCDEPLTVKHILICNQFNDARTACGMAADPATAFGNNKRALRSLMEFLNQTELLHHL